MQLSNLVQKIQPSATIAAAAKAQELKRKGVDICEFTLGEPDFETPIHIREAAKLAMDSGKTHYTPTTGIPELKSAIAAAAQRDEGLKFDPSQISVANGSKHSLHNVLTAVCNPGDEVIIPAPYWVSYRALVEIVGAIPVIVPTAEENGFCLHPEQFLSAITSKTKLLMLNNPGNPTGAVYPVETLERLAKIAVEKDVSVLSDEIYSKLVYEGSTFRSFASFGDDVAERTIIVTGVSKAYAMTGWRIGWSIAPKEVAKAINNLQSQQTSNPCSVSQYATIAALEGDQNCIEEMRQEFDKRRTFTLERVGALPNVSLAEPGGAFYVFFDVSKHFGRPLGGGVNVGNSSDFCTGLLEAAHVALVTGDAFGAPGYVRLSFASSLDVLAAGFDRLEKFLRG